MTGAEWAARLAAADEAERAARLAEVRDPLAVAHALKTYYDDAESADPQRAAAAAAALGALAAFHPHPEIAALAAWTAGMAALDAGKMEEAVNRLQDAHARFTALAQPQAAAAVQVSQLYGLAVLGRYAEAVQVGAQARQVFTEHGDELAAGKIEQNLGNLEFRRGRYPEAEALYRAARERFAALGDLKLLTLAENGLANVISERYLFREAQALYATALARAQAAGLAVQQAMLEGNLGALALDQGLYDRALDFLERSRRGYAALDMPHESAIAELEMAEAYLELNLAPEAAALYARLSPRFAALEMRAEQALALLNHGRAALLLGEAHRAAALLTQAHALYVEEANALGAANVRRVEALAAYAQGDFQRAAALAAEAEPALAEAGALGRALLARWLRGEAARARGQSAEARAYLAAALAEAERERIPQVAQRCHTSLGLLAAGEGRAADAEAAFRRAIAIIEDLRAPLPAEDFRAAFVADKLTPYAEMVRLCLAAGSRERLAEALDYVERARSRALADQLAGGLQARPEPRDPFEAELLTRLDRLRQELNWFYSQINRPPEDGGARRLAHMNDLHSAAREREAELLEIERQLRLKAPAENGLSGWAPFDLAHLQRVLGEDAALVEYFSLDGELLAFVVTPDSIELARGLGAETEVEAALAAFRFQIDALRFGAARMRAHLPQLAERARAHLAELYTQLLAPLEARLGRRQLVVVPHRALHYVPFHALYDGRAYVIERRAVSYAPSAAVLRRCFDRPLRPLERAVLLGAPDAQTPHVRAEIHALAALFPQPDTLLDEQATLAALRERAPAADVLHLACHGQFRPDNPLFSSLRLADGWLTVREAYALDLGGALVTLSACETGVSAVAPGDELISLARGFFVAGAPTLLVSQWPVDDAATAELMSGFYRRLRAGLRPAAALRHAQLDLLRRQPHPYFWSPFVLLGRW